MSTWSLLYSDDIAYSAELQWRISVLLLIPVIALIAVPMSRVSPRQGRFTKLLPAVLVYIGYFIALEFCRDRMLTETSALRSGSGGCMGCLQRPEQFSFVQAQKVSG